MANEQSKTLEGAIRNTSLRIDKLPFFADQPNDPLVVVDAVTKAQKPGQFFVSMKKEIVATMPGSSMTPEGFMKEIGAGERPRFIENIASNYFGSTDNPAMQIKSPDNNFSLTVYHGSFNKRAQELTRLATMDLNDEQVRASYQSNVFEIMKPIFRKKSTYDVRIAEDCIASGDVIAGVKAAMAKIRPDLVQGILRVDVAVATAQGILLLKKFAQDNHIKLDLNVGHLAFGLSSGYPVDGSDAREHANYIIYPKEFLDRAPKEIAQSMERYRAQDGNLYVVGDMGDAAKSLAEDSSRYGWNAYRNDNHGPRNGNSNGDENKELITGHTKVDVFLKRGGYLIKSMVDYVAGLGLSDKQKQMIFYGNRIWATDPHGYGVLINGMPLNDGLAI